MPVGSAGNNVNVVSVNVEQHVPYQKPMQNEKQKQAKQNQLLLSKKNLLEDRYAWIKTKGAGGWIFLSAAVACFLADWSDISADIAVETWKTSASSGSVLAIPWKK